MVLAALFFMHRYFFFVDPSFATSATIRYHYAGKHIDAKVSTSDLKALKEILHGYRWYDDGLSCGFSMDTSIRLSGNGRSITFLPACDACPNFRTGNTGWYIEVPEPDRKRFERIVAKYGMTFPCE